MTISPNASTVWRNYETDGVPSSGNHKVKKSATRTWGTAVETVINAFTANGGLIFTLRASLDAQLSYTVGTMAWVLGDPVVANNGIYQKIGASGTGSWNRVADLPFSFIIASDVGAGTANAIVATTSIPVSSSALVWMNIFEANTSSPVTVAFNGESSLTIKTNAGNDIAAGGLTSGMIVLGIVSGSTFRLVSDQASASIVAAAEAAQVAAEAAQVAAEAAQAVAVAAASSIAHYNTRAAAAAVDLSGVDEVTVDKWDSSSLYAPAVYAKVAVEPSHAAKFQSADLSWWEISGDVLDIRSFGALLDGVTSDTTAVVLAASSAFAGKEIRFPVKSFVVNGTIPVYSRLIGIAGKPTAKLTVAGGADMTGDRGFWIKPGGQMHNFVVERGVTAGAISGEFNNAIVVGEYSTSGLSYSDIHMSGMELIGVDAGAGRRSIMGIYGNTHDCSFADFKFSGFISYACMIHWGGDFDPTLPDTGAVTASWHPRRLRLQGFTMSGPLPDQGLGCVYISGGHDISVKDLFVNGVRTPVVVAAGDVGGLVAQGDSKGHILKAISFENITLSDYAVAGVLMSGASGTRAGGLWLAINEGAQVAFKNLVIQRGPLSGTNTRAFDCRLMTGVTVDGIDISHGVGASDINYTPAIFLQACDDISITGQTTVPFAHELIGCGKKVRLDTNDLCLRTDYDANCIGTRLTGQSGAHTLGAALSIGATSVTLTALSFDVVAGSTITIGGRTMVLTQAAMTSASAVTLSITPSFVAAASSDAATVEKYTGDIEHSGSCEGFHTGYLVNNTSGGKAKGAVIRRRHFRRNGLYDIYARAARNLRILDNVFEEGGQLDTSSCNNIRMIDSCVGTIIRGNTFEDNGDASTLVRHNVYLFGNNSGSIISGNEFYQAQTSAINKFAPSTATDEDHDIGGNWWGPLLPSGATGRISGTAGYFSTTVGDQRLGWGSAAPTTGSWRDGDVIWNTNAVASGKAGWICTAAGSPGTWKTFAAIDA